MSSYISLSSLINQPSINSPSVKDSSENSLPAAKSSLSYSARLFSIYNQLKDEPTPHKKQICKDITRTYPEVDMFKEEQGQQALERVLSVYSLYNAEVGYCQGLAFIVGALLMKMPEEEAFCVFVRLMETYGMRSMYTQTMEGVHLRAFQFDALLSEYVPEVSKFLIAQGIAAKMYATQWFLTMFTTIFPLPIILSLFDSMFLDGPFEVAMRLGLSLIKKSSVELLKCTEFEDIIFILLKKLTDPYQGNFNLLIEESVVLRDSVTREKLAELEKWFYLLKKSKEKKAKSFPADTKKRPMSPPPATPGKKKTRTSTSLKDSEYKDGFVMVPGDVLPDELVYQSRKSTNEKKTKGIFSRFISIFAY